MPKFRDLPKSIFRLIKRPPQVAYALGFGALIGRLVLLLTTTGRVTGKLRVTPLQYEQVGDTILVGAARGLSSDWVRNLLANPEVDVRVKSERFRARAEVICDPEEIVEFLEVRLERRPRMMGAMLKADGIPPQPSRAQLLGYAAKIVVVKLHPHSTDSDPVTPEREAR